MELEELVGQKLMIGIAGTQVTPEMVARFRETQAGGLIIFRPNFESANQFKKLISNLEEALGRRLLVAVDHEGGRVIHLAEGVTVFPDNLALGNTNREEYAKRQGQIEARELRRLGIDLNLAPTLDVLTENFSPNIGIRSYGKDPDRVARLGVARIKAMQAGGLSACAKHFPGQGHSSMDAHLGLPVLNSSWEEMKKLHLKPFRAAIRAGVDAVMSSHPIYPKLDSRPATFSRRIIRDCLRDEMGFDGVVLSDDLEMGALKKIASAGEAAVRAVRAGHDMVLVCHDLKAQREVYQSLLEAYQNKDLSLAELEKTVARIESLKRKRSERFEDGKVQPEPDGISLARQIAKEAVKISSDELVPAKSISVIFPKLSGLNDRIFIEENLLDEKKFVQRMFAKKKIQPPEIHLVSFDPTKPEFEKAIAGAKRAVLTLFFCYDAHLFPGMRKLLDAVQTSAQQCAVVLLRDPYDETFVKPGVSCVIAFGFRAVQIVAAIEKLFHP